MALCTPIVAANLAMLMSGCPSNPPVVRRDTGVRRDAGDACPSTELRATRGHPSVVWVVEHSCGASLRVNGQPSTSATDAQSRFSVAAEGIRRAQQRFTDTFNWGLLAHPGDAAACGTSVALRVEPAADSGPRVLAELASNEVNAFNYCTANPSSGSGIGDALSALAETNLADTEQAIVVVLGMSAPTCGNTDAAILGEQTGALADLGYVIPVIQVGSAAAAVDSLEAIAARGGGGIASETPFRFTAADARSLDTAITSALTSSSACVFSLTDAGEIPPEELVVMADGEPVPADPEEGFGYWPPDGTITFRGSYCEQLLEGAIASVRIERVQCGS